MEIPTSSFNILNEFRHELALSYAAEVFQDRKIEVLGNIDPQSQSLGIRREQVVKTDVLKLSVSISPKYCFR